MNILMISRFQHSGRTRHILTLGNELSRLGHRVDILMPGMPLQLKNIFNKCFRNVIYNLDKLIINKLFDTGIDLLHSHTIEEVALVTDLSRRYSLPYYCTLHENLSLPLNEERLVFFKGAFGVIIPHPIVFNELKNVIPGIIHIPEGVNINPCRPVINKNIKVAYIAEEGNYTRESYYAVSKAVGLAGLPLDVISFDKPVGKERHHGWTINTAPILAESDILIAGGRALVEGIASRNAALIMGTCYNGVFHPPDSLQGALPDYSGSRGKDPCYRDIFYDLSAIIKDTDLRHCLQEDGYQYACSNFDINSVVKQTLQVYQMGS